jgi:uncharacterized membrane protein YuzA (DUF378 family)
MKLNTLDIVSLVLVVVGGLNWGLVGIGVGDVVTQILGGGMLTNIVFDLVGLAAIYLAVVSVKLARK